MTRYAECAGCGAYKLCAKAVCETCAHEAVDAHAIHHAKYAGRANENSERAKAWWAERKIGMTGRELSFALGVSESRISTMRAKGMPITGATEARAWIAANRPDWMPDDPF